MKTQTMFAEGQILTTRFINDSASFLKVEIMRRTPKMVSIKIEGEKEKRCKIHEREGVEFIYPMGDYSMAPVVKAPEMGL